MGVRVGVVVSVKFGLRVEGKREESNVAVDVGVSEGASVAVFVMVGVLDKAALPVAL